MNCKEFKKRLADEPRIPDSSALEAHASSCSRCARLLEDRRLAAAALGMLRQAGASEQASPRIEQQLLAAFRSSRIPAFSRPSRPSFHAAWSWAAAAAAAVVVGMVLWRLSVPEPETQTAGSANAPAAAIPNPDSADTSIALRTGSAPPAAEAWNAVPGGKPGLAAQSSSRKEAAPANRRRPRPAEGTDFFPTMLLAGDEPGSDLQLVRVRVSQRTLEMFGLSVDPRLAGRPVKADMLIGPDGLTRAVRFIGEW